MKAEWFKMPDRRVTAAIDASRPKSFWRGFWEGKIGRRDYFICVAILIALYLLSPKVVPGVAWVPLFMSRAKDTEKRTLWSILALVIILPENFFLKPSMNALNEAYGRGVVGWVMLAVVAAHLGFAVMLGMQRSSTVKSTS